ncbi:MAG: hypothetical protein HKN80_10845 [Acidimicrobiia bacterium]|nr:hypothetical protein [Acidimicrobiia bacterium]
MLGLFTDEGAETLATEAYAIATRDLLVLAAFVTVLGLVVWGASRMTVVPKSPMNTGV